MPPLTQRISAMARGAGMPVCGGNGMGFYNDEAGVWSAGFPPIRGAAARHHRLHLATRARSSAPRPQRPRFRFNLAVSAGQELVTTAADYLDYALEHAVDAGGRASSSRPCATRPASSPRSRKRPSAATSRWSYSRSAAPPASAALALSPFRRHRGRTTPAYQRAIRASRRDRVETLDEIAATPAASSRKAAPAATGGLAAIQDSGGEREMLIDLAAAHGVPFARSAPRPGGAARGQPRFRARAGQSAGRLGHRPRIRRASSRDCLAALLDDPDSGARRSFRRRPAATGCSITTAMPRRHAPGARRHDEAGRLHQQLGARSATTSWRCT